MNRDNWKYMNTMPAAFRKKTTDAFLMESKKINAQLNQLQAANRERDQAVAEAEKSAVYQFLKNPENDGYVFCTLEGKWFISWAQAKQMFINYCRNLDHSWPAKIMTMWYEDKWQTLETVAHKKPNIQDA